MNSLKKPAIFTLAVMPIVIIATVLTCLYQFDLYPPEIMEEAIAQVGSRWLVIVISVVQSVGMVAFCAFVGYLLADKMGLIRPWRLEKRVFWLAVCISVITGIVFSLDYWTFGTYEPYIRDSVFVGMTPQGILSAVLYGGIVEEIMMRLFFLTLIAWLLKKTLFRKREARTTTVLVLANLIAALAFAAGHLPVTSVTFGALTPLLLLRCFLLNGGFGFVFGHLYYKHGLLYAMIGHALTHLVARLIWVIFI